MSLFTKMINGETIDITADDLKGCTFIAERGFSSSKINSVVLPETIKTIGEYGFSNINLKSIHISNSVINIEPFAFYFCSGLTEIEIPNASIGDSAFSSSVGLLKITVGEGVSYIGQKAFANTGGAMKIENAYFRQPSGMTVTLPTAGESTGMFRVKTARNMNIYTDNETIKNYDYASDNITPTFYHLDGTAW